MPVFEYKALSSTGKPVQGLREAESPKALRAALKRDGVFLTDLLGEKQQQAQQAREVNVRRWVVGRVSADDLAITTRQLAVLVHAGIPLIEALNALVEQVEHERLKRVISDVKQRVNEGSSLADALAVHAKVFSTLYVNMIRAGESSGALDVVLVRLADFTESQARLRSKVMRVSHSTRRSSPITYHMVTRACWFNGYVGIFERTGKFSGGVPGFDP